MIVYIGHAKLAYVITSQATLGHPIKIMSSQPSISYINPVVTQEEKISSEESSFAQNIGKVLRGLRKQRELSLNDLAGLSGVSRSMLSQMETGRSVPSVMVLCKIARTFDVPISTFLKNANEVQPTLLSAEETPLQISAQGKCAWRQLTTNKGGNKMEFYEITLSAGGIKTVEPYPPETMANLAVSSGTTIIAMRNLRYRLSEGDVLEFPASVAHSYINPGHEQALLYLVLQLQHPFGTSND
jgi:transcriptional regulator with XRE-family HTH domain